MRTYSIPHSGRLLVSQQAAYGLAAIIDSAEHPAYVSHDRQSLELTASVETNADIAIIAERIRSSASACRTAVEADIEPGTRGNDRLPVIRARATKPEGAEITLRHREELLDELDGPGSHLAAGLVTGLGCPAPWLSDGRATSKQRPQDGATRLDGVPYNIGSDIVRGALRHCLPAAETITDDILQGILGSDVHDAGESPDRFRWSPAGVQISLPIQWCAAMGMALLPVGLRASEPARTPGSWRTQQRRRAPRRGITLPILDRPASVARLRAILQLPALAVPEPAPHESARLRSLAVSALAVFPVRDASTSQMVQFSFDAADRHDL